MYDDKNENFKKDIVTWLMDFVEVPNKNLDGWSPCPYAKEARLANKIKYVWTESDEFLHCIRSEVEGFDDRYDVVVLGAYPENITPEDIKLIKAELEALLKREDVWVLFDHPSIEEVSRGVCFNNKKYVLAMVQRLSKLNVAAGKLKKEGYYDNWDEDYYQQLKNSRPGFDN